MKYLLDTCILAELVKPQAQQMVIDWIKHSKESTLFISVLTLGEIQKGISKLVDSRRKVALQTWLDEDLPIRFAERILDVTPQIARSWGILQGHLELQGKKMPVMDGLIATTAIVHQLVLVTRNVADMQRSGVPIFNPWELTISQ